MCVALPAATDAPTRCTRIHRHPRRALHGGALTAAGLRLVQGRLRLNLQSYAPAQWHPRERRTTKSVHGWCKVAATRKKKSYYSGLCACYHVTAAEGRPAPAKRASPWQLVGTGEWQCGLGVGARPPRLPLVNNHDPATSCCSGAVTDAPARADPTHSSSAMPWRGHPQRLYPSSLPHRHDSSVLRRRAQARTEGTLACACSLAAHARANSVELRVLTERASSCYLVGLAVLAPVPHRRSCDALPAADRRHAAWFRPNLRPLQEPASDTTGALELANMGSGAKRAYSWQSSLCSRSLFLLFHTGRSGRCCDRTRTSRSRHLAAWQ